MIYSKIKLNVDILSGIWKSKGNKFPVLFQFVLISAKIQFFKCKLWFFIFFPTQIDWLKKNKFGGVGIWSLDLDDFFNGCGSGSYVLMKALEHNLK